MEVKPAHGSQKPQEPVKPPLAQAHPGTQPLATAKTAAARWMRKIPKKCSRLSPVDDNRHIMQTDDKESLSTSGNDDGASDDDMELQTAGIAYQRQPQQPLGQCMPIYK